MSLRGACDEAISTRGGTQVEIAALKQSLPAVALKSRSPRFARDDRKGIRSLAYLSLRGACDEAISTYGGHSSRDRRASLAMTGRALGAWLICHCEEPATKQSLPTVGTQVEIAALRSR
ncbi:hypothetical protein [Vreelandella titanicae]|uniref:hypothetical protein n=1 Tax=Vreelandella titanicae TaxID=664683 RepID=UPI0013307E98|nr:hypothetical protein [Halomonas titanicae]